MEDEKKKEIMLSNNFKCQKCGYYSPLGKGLDVHKNSATVLCSICGAFAPEEADKLAKYLEETLDWQALETFRNSGINRASHSPNKMGMLEKSKQGKLMARPPFGYRVKKGNLIPDEETFENVRLIFEEFSAGKSLNQISQTYGISVNGLKKVLKNFTYIGKIKFDNQISQGSHTPLISAELFNRVQSKFESLDKNKDVE